MLKIIIEYDNDCNKKDLDYFLKCLKERMNCNIANINFRKNSCFKFENSCRRCGEYIEKNFIELRKVR